MHVSIDALYVVVLSLIPTFEGRYALLVGIAGGLSPLTSFIAASLGVGILAYALPWILPLADVIASRLAEKGPGPLRLIAGAYLSYLGKARQRAGRYVEKYGVPGLILFVAVPLPVTGVWTGAIAAYVLGMKRAKAIPALLLGGIFSNTITLILALMAGRAV